MLFVFLGERCYQPNNEIGRCQILGNCPSLDQLYRNNQQSREILGYLVQSQKNCGTRNVNRNPIVCCPPQAPTPQPQRQTTTTTTTTTTQRPVSRATIANCQDPNTVPGICTNIKNCESVLQQFIARQTDAVYIRYIQNSNANCNYNGQDICCPLEDAPPATQAPVTQAPVTQPPSVRTPPPQTGDYKYDFLTPLQGCGSTNISHNRVVGGVDAEPGGWPWMALLGYTNAFGEVDFKCGGSLISKRHVLTASHCIISSL